MGFTIDLRLITDHLSEFLRVSEIAILTREKFFVGLPGISTTFDELRSLYRKFALAEHV